MIRKCEICEKEYDSEKDGVEFGVGGEPIYFCSLDCFQKAAKKSRKTAGKVSQLIMKKIKEGNQ